MEYERFILGEIVGRLDGRCAFCFRTEPEAGPLISGLTIKSFKLADEDIELKPSICSGCVDLIREIFQEESPQSPKIVPFRSKTIGG